MAVRYSTAGLLFAARLSASYVGEDNERKVPVMITAQFWGRWNVSSVS